MKKTNVQRLVTAALFAALICIATMVFAIPLPGGGFANLGDCFVITGGILLGSPLGVLAAAIGSGIDISRACGSMVVDIGGGTTDIAVISLGGTVVSTSIKIAGDNFDDAIVKYMRKKHNILIGERTAEALKINIGTAYERTMSASMEVRGRNLITGLPKNITVTSEEMHEALYEQVNAVVDAVHSVLEKTPPELAADISDRGIVMTGGGSLLYGLDKLIKVKTGITAMVAEDSVSCVAIGTGEYIDYLTGGSKGTKKRRRRRKKSSSARRSDRGERQEKTERLITNGSNKAEEVYIDSEYGTDYESGYTGEYDDK